MESLLLNAVRGCWVGLALCLSGCNGMFYYPTHKVYVHPEKLNIKYRDYFFPSGDETLLHGRFFYHRSEEPARGLFMLFHGNAENLTSHYLQFAWVLEPGYDLFVFDYAGYGGSQGAASRGSSLASGAAALKFASDSLLPAFTGRLVLVGQSLGGAILLRCLPDWKDRDKVHLALIDCSFPSYRKVARKSLSETWWTWPLQPLTYVLLSENGGPERSIPKVAPIPMLVTSCKQDLAVDPSLSRDIYQLARPPKWLWEFDACGHIQGFRSQTNRFRLLNFLDSVPAAKERAHAS